MHSLHSPDNHAFASLGPLTYTAHLYGNQDNSHYKQIRKEANCNMLVHKHKESNKPMTMSTTHLNENPYEADKHFAVARKMIEEILLQFKLPGLPSIGQDGSRGRLLYEISKSFGKNPRQSTSEAVTQLNPFKVTKHCCMSIVEVPSQYTIKGKTYHGDINQWWSYVEMISIVP